MPASTGGATGCGAGDCLNGKGYKNGEETRAKALKSAANTRLGFAGLSGLLTLYEVYKNYKKKARVEESMVAIAEQQQHHLKRVYWPKELEFLEEFATPEQIETAEAYGRRHAGRLVSTISHAFSQELAKLKCGGARYCTSQREKNLQDLYLTYGQAVGNARVLGRVMGFMDVKRREDRDFERRVQAIGMGKGLMGKAAKLYGSALAGLDALGSELSGQLSQSLTMLGSALQQGRSARSRLAQLSSVSSGAEAAGAGTLSYSSNWGGVQDAPGVGVYSLDYLHNEMPDQEYSWSFGARDMLGSIGDQDPQITYHDPGTIRSIASEKANTGEFGNEELARSGSVTYRTTGYDGYPIQITVNQSDFPLQWVDDKAPGDK